MMQIVRQFCFGEWNGGPLATVVTIGGGNRRCSNIVSPVINLFVKSGCHL